MFELSLVESRGLVGSGTARWTALGSMTVQFLLAGLVIAIPLFRPEALPMLSNAPKLVVPLAPKPPVPVVKVEPAASSSTAAIRAPATSATPMLARTSLLAQTGGMADGAAPTIDTGLRMPAGGGGPLSALSVVGMSGPGPGLAAVRTKASGPLRVSSGVSAGMLLTEIRPVYPAIARAARVEGTVVMEAVISKAGRIESLHAVSGPAMLRRAALEAVQAARYEPYKLNGEVTEVQTTITVNFRIGS